MFKCKIFFVILKLKEIGMLVCGFKIMCFKIYVIFFFFFVLIEVYCIDFLFFKGGIIFNIKNIYNIIIFV